MKKEGIFLIILIQLKYNMIIQIARAIIYFIKYYK